MAFFRIFGYVESLGSQLHVIYRAAD